MRVVVTGATGFLGRPLCAALLHAGHGVTALARDAQRARALLGPQINSVAWGQDASGAWQQAIGEADGVIHLAGESIGGQRWTPEVKRRLVSSRVDTTRALVEAMRRADRRPSVFLCTSATGYYGDRGEETVTEETPPGSDFLADLAKRWEAEACHAEELGIRVARMRVGIVLGDGGALQEMLYPLPVPVSPWKFGLGGPLGNGRQWVPWVHQDDVIGMYAWALENPQASGPINVTAPNPARNADLARALGRVLHRPAVLPVPGFALKWIVGELAQFLLEGQKVFPTAARRLGYRFQRPDIEPALRAILT